MNAKQPGQASTKARRSIRRRWWLLSLGVLLIAALVIIYASQSETARARALSDSVRTIAPIVHTVVNQASPPSATAAETRTMDAGAQGTMNYIRVHDKIPDWMILHFFHADKIYTY